MQTKLAVQGAIGVAVTASVILAVALWPSPGSSVAFQVGGDRIVFGCEVADTPSERATGLMDRESLPADECMLFVYQEPANLTFWMKNTLIPLDIVFIGEDHRVLNIWEAVPEPGVDDADLTRYNSLGPAKWVVELNFGLCELNGISPGTEVSINI